MEHAQNSSAREVEADAQRTTDPPVKLNRWAPGPGRDPDSKQKVENGWEMYLILVSGTCVCTHAKTHTKCTHEYTYTKNIQNFLIIENNAVNITRIIKTLATRKKDGASVDFHNHEVRAVPIRLLTCNVIKMHCPTTGLRPWNYQMAEQMKTRDGTHPTSHETLWQDITTTIVLMKM